MTHAIRIHSYGGPEVLTWESVNVGEPGPDQVRLRHTAIGLNFIDVYERTGLYPGALPGGLGREAAGVVEAVGPNVHHLKVGDRIAYTLSVAGSYAEQRVAPAERLIKVPDSIADDAAAAIMLKGLTAQALLRRTYRVQPGDTVLVHAAAGGVGLLLVQWAKHLGARVIGIVGNESKAKLAREHGADLVLLDTSDWVSATRDYTNKLGVAAVYDSVGQATFMRSLDCLRPLGMMITFGNASGPVAPVAPLELAKRGSLFLTRPTLFHYIATRAELQAAADELFAVIAQGAVRVHIGQRYALRDAAQAHRDLESRRTVGATVLLP
ncbi:MAG: quinone oxidoreductase [Candidatus Obscuribacterales bacterium]|nr:quinone oxidoreductase [Steroidobacteraceae bacterium]